MFRKPPAAKRRSNRRRSQRKSRNRRRGFIGPLFLELVGVVFLLALLSGKEQLLDQPTTHSSSPATISNPAPR